MKTEQYLKGFTVCTKDGEYGTLVLASNRNKAKAYCEKTEDVGYATYSGLLVQRCKSIDLHAKLFGAGILKYNLTPYIANIYRNLMWDEIDEKGFPTRKCRICGKNEYILVPRSKLNSNGVCGFCKGRGK
jgi:hypothetical protein